MPSRRVFLHRCCAAAPGLAGAGAMMDYLVAKARQ